MPDTQTLGQLQSAFQLYAVCDPCRRIVEVDISALIEREGEHCRIDVVRQRLRCRGCQARTGAIRIVYVGPERKAASFRYTR